VLAVGAHVVFDGRAWQVVGLEGQVVRLLDKQGAVASVLTGHLFAAADFAVIGAAVRVGVPQWGLFQTVPLREQERALAWQRHIQEVETGLPSVPGGAGVPRPQYDPQRRTMAQREQAKEEELAALGWSGVGSGAVTRMRSRYRRLPIGWGAATSGSWPRCWRRCGASAGAPRAPSKACCSSRPRSWRRPTGRGQ